MIRMSWIFKHWETVYIYKAEAAIKETVSYWGVHLVFGNADIMTGR